MDARPLPEDLARARQNRTGSDSNRQRRRGAPVTTVDFDFFFRKTPPNLDKLKALARDLDGILLRPHYPVSDLYRGFRPPGRLHGKHPRRALLRRLARSIRPGEARRLLLVARLAAIVNSKRAAAHPGDKAVLDILEKALH